MYPYVIKQGDYLAKIAHRFGFTAMAVWKDENNAALRAARPNPNILYPGDVLYIPGPSASPAAPRALTVGSSNSFTSTGPTVPISVQFVGSDDSTYASQPFQIAELPALTGLKTDQKGVATLAAPVSLEHLTVSFPSTGEAFVLHIGGMDPVNTVSGIFARLKNLGYIDRAVEFDPTDLAGIRAALRLLKVDSVPPSSEAASEPPSSDAGSGPVAGADASSATHGEFCDGFDEQSGDDAGLDDDGNLDDQLTQLLVHLHGS